MKVDLEPAHQTRRAGRFKKARQMYEDALLENPQNAAARAALSLTLVYMRKNEAALLEADRALELDPDQPLAHIARGVVFHAQGRRDLYKEEIENAFALQPLLYEVGCTYARLLYDEKRIDEAVPLFERTVEADPRKVCPHYFLGQIHVHKRQYAQALREFVTVFRIQPSLESAMAVCAVLLMRYAPWSHILHAAAYFAGLIWALGSRWGAVTVGLYTLFLVTLGARQRFLERRFGWAAFDVVAWLVLALAFYYLYMQAPG
jgi:tetratricopeptide (TPR) repeat protein